jgi:hypothetical protein
MWPFGNKVSCFQCDVKVKESTSRYRRGFRFCSDACVKAFLDANPMRPRADVPQSEYRRQAALELGLALTELNRLLGTNAVMLSQAAGVILEAAGVAQAIQAREAARDSVFHFSSHVTNALPFLYALGRQPDIDYLECVNLEPVAEMSVLGAGPAQDARIRQLVRPVAERVAGIAQAIAG